MSDKKKNWLLGILFLVMLCVVYQLAIKRTLVAKKQNIALLKEKKQVSNAVSRIKYLQKKNNHLDSVLKVNNISIKNSFQETLLERITHLCKKESIEVISFYKPHFIISNNIAQYTYSFQLKGNFIGLLKLIDVLEHDKLGEFISVNFEKKKDYKKNRNFLVASVLLQTVGVE